MIFKLVWNWRNVSLGNQTSIEEFISQIISTHQPCFAAFVKVQDLVTPNCFFFTR